ncbi:NAD(P)-dependent alcohol dehydrogenase [Agrococcus sp. ARC_14]|uniref:NAD(P)-dependent alcohol dehydrogenase n=1 Tax=Agrococcus sp. ARC_14 TaxID=2919927 RepID=UPI001F05EE36|nr:NAD(P)-dependent alcohol dehydrogenase [Agrococcus sp. ARC_14]MCH1882383.1 NAD(P)-dependent alcohol dehydrogenase [Agrococcus sp. ARC_14]
MRAVVVEQYGPPSVARISDLPAPEPRAGQVLVRVVSAAVTAGDARIRAARFPAGMGVPGRLALGLRGPRNRVLGMVASGTVEALGADVTGFAIGDEVAGMAGARMGAHAELLAIEASRLVHKPAGVSPDAAAAAIFGGTTAAHFLHDVARLRAGQDVLVVGASGAVGTSAVQLAALAGATVTGVTSGRNAELVRRLGADEIVDYTNSDPAALGRRFDVILDAAGTLTPQTARALVREGGTAVLAAADLRQMLSARGPVTAGTAPGGAALVERLMPLLERGELDPVIQESMSLDEIARAYEIVDSGHKVGNVVVRP